MIYYQYLEVELPESASSQRLPINEPVNQALGDVPGFVILNLPEYNPDVRYRNIAAEFDVVNSGYAAPEYATLPSGERVFLIPDGGGVGFQPLKSRVNPERWSGFAYLNAPAEQGIYARGQYFGADDSLDPQDSRIALSLAHVRTTGSQRGFYIYENKRIREEGQPVRLSWLTDDGVTTPGLVMWTFSVEHGLSIWWNGERKAVNTEDKRPLETGIDEIRTLFRARGDVGVHGLLNIDLNAPENAGYRVAIEKFALNKYGI